MSQLARHTLALAHDHDVLAYITDDGQLAVQEIIVDVTTGETSSTWVTIAATPRSFRTWVGY